VVVGNVKIVKASVAVYVKSVKSIFRLANAVGSCELTRSATGLRATPVAVCERESTGKAR